MRDYKLYKIGRYARKSEVRRRIWEIHMPTLLICFLLACLIWLYIVGLSRIPVDTPALPSDTEETTVVTEEQSASETEAASASEL